MKVFLYIFLSLFLFACGGKSEVDSVNSTKKASTKIDALSKEIKGVLKVDQVGVTPNGEIAKLYVDKNNLIYDASNNKVVIKDAYAKRYWLTMSNQYVHIFWWVKFNVHNGEELTRAGKTLYVSSSQDGGKTFSSPYTLNKSHGVLPDVHIVSDENGHVSVAYLDERFKGYQIFNNTSHDGGKTWLTEDVQLSQPLPDADKTIKTTKAVTPSLHKYGNKLIAIWEQVEKYDDKLGVSLVSRSSGDFGKTWSQSEVIYRSFGRLSVELHSFSSDKEVYLLAVLEEGLALFVKGNEGAWRKVDDYAPLGSKSKLSSYFKTAHDNQFLYISFINVKGSTKADYHTELLIFDKKTGKWGNKQSFDALSISMNDASRGGYQDLAILEDGTLVIVWEDFRGILPSVFMNYSKDQGKTWLTEPLVLNKVGSEYANMPFLKTHKNKFHVFYKSFVLKNQQASPQASTVSISLPSPASKEFAEIGFIPFKFPDQKKAVKRIKERLTELMELRLKPSEQNIEKEWMYLDPIYRSSVRKSSWEDSRKLMTYYDYSISSVNIKGSFGYVNGDMKFALSNKLPGANVVNKEVEEKKSQNYLAKWGWFEDDWYLILDNTRQSYLP